MEDPHAFIGQVFACSGETAEQIVRRGRLRTFASRATILRQGDWLGLAFLLILGRAHALLYSADGQVVLLHEYRPGDLFGAVGEIEPVRQECDVLAVEEVRALVLEAAELAMLAQQHACIGLALSRMLIRRLRQAREAKDFTIRPAPVLSELALRVATTRETASRAVNALVRRGIVRREADALVVVSPLRLEEAIL